MKWGNGGGGANDEGNVEWCELSGLDWMDGAGQGRLVAKKCCLGKIMESANG